MVVAGMVAAQGDLEVRSGGCNAKRSFGVCVWRPYQDDHVDEGKDRHASSNLLALLVWIISLLPWIVARCEVKV